MNQETGEDLDPRHKEGRFPKGGGKPKRQSTEAPDPVWEMLAFGIFILEVCGGSQSLQSPLLQGPRLFGHCRRISLKKMMVVARNSLRP